MFINILLGYIQNSYFKGGSKMDYIEFYNGNQMPMLGLGTFRVENDDTCKEAVKHAIESGIVA